MSKGNTFENDWLRLIFWGDPIANIADNATVSPLALLYASLHSADPGEAGNQATSEAAYAGYARVAVPRAPSGWTISGSIVHPAAAIIFPELASGSGNYPFFGIGTALSGAGKLLYYGPITNSAGGALAPSAGIAPYIGTDTVITED